MTDGLTVPRLMCDNSTGMGIRKCVTIRSSDSPLLDRADDVGNMRALGVRSLFVSCWNCHHQAVLSADRWQVDVAVPAFGPRTVCTRCGIVGADARPNWKERPQRETLTGVQWRC
jgi:hypothetical protein